MIEATAIRLLKRCIKKSGLSASGYATEILLRDPRTIRRWLEGTAPIPPAVVAFLTRKDAEAVA